MTRRLALLLAVLLLALIAPPAAQATVVAYLDGGQVWVASPDGSRKEQLSTGPEGWIAVTVADNGRILGVWNEPGKIFQLATMTLWDERGNVISQGPLPSDAAGWSSYAAPLSLDLTSDAVFVAYGYSGIIGTVGFGATFPRGFNAVLSDTKVNLKPIDQSGFEYPTTVGRRVVAKSGKTPLIQKPTTGNPFVASSDWDPMNIDVSGAAGNPDLRRTDVAANGAFALVEMDFTGSADRIGAIALTNLAAPPTPATDCFLPSAGDATDASAAPDGALIAWKDDGGVKVAGAPGGTADLCSLASGPVVISATGKAPSLGGGDLATLKPVAAPPPTPTPPPAAPVITVTPPPAKGAFAALGSRAGLPVTVGVPAAGRVTVTATVPAARLGLKGKPIVVASGSARPKAKGKVKLRLKLNAKGKRYRKRLRGVTVTLRITQNGVTTTRTLRLR